MKKAILIILGSLLGVVALISFGGILLVVFSKNMTHLTEYSEDCRCPLSPNDPFDQALKLQFGAESGKCIDSCTHRSLVQIPNTQAKEIAIANVWHEDRFYIARFQSTDIDSAQILLEQFAPHIYHTAFEFKFTNGRSVTLTDQMNPKKIVQVDRLIFSPEAFPPKEAPYTLWKGFWLNYPTPCGFILTRNSSTS